MTVRLAAEARRARTPDRVRSARLREALSGWLALRRRTRVWRRDTAAFHRALAAAGTPAARHDLLATSSRRRQPATAPNEEGGMNRWMSWSSGAGVAGASTAPRAAFLMPVATNTDVGLTGAANELGHLVTGGGTMALDAARALPIHGPLPRCRA